ncbi:ribosome recycling factor [Candidatus Liberibacter sp.]|uniref:ribosome recycling factor n=1 Tax=Candidatus Liberibacter sp. TaxID=34022 RepID=UPI0015F74EB6|nr:ribosome recycling factor [Candidatus Liberibacter sp.]MBA5724453.1 ribosome recycling factor [Candidatus Liberibacter sp.]
MCQNINLEVLKKRMDEAVSFFKKDMMTLRTGRVSSSILDPVRIDAYGSRIPLNQVANVVVMDSRTLSVSVWDRSMVSAVERGIHESSLGLNPIVEGQILRIPVPEVTEERRLSLVKVAQNYLEKGKVSIRNIRRDGMDILKKSKKIGSISEDDFGVLVAEIQKITDAMIIDVDVFFEEKKKEILNF